MIEATRHFARETGVPLSSFEFQFLHGIRQQRQEELAQAGYQVRIYVPYGTAWYPYFMRRLAERPANLWFFISNFVRG
jgi:proline dehydrogenase